MSHENGEWKNPLILTMSSIPFQWARIQSNPSPSGFVISSFARKTFWKTEGRRMANGMNLWGEVIRMVRPMFHPTLQKWNDDFWGWTNQTRWNTFEGWPDFGERFCQQKLVGPHPSAKIRISGLHCMSVLFFFKTFCCFFFSWCSYGLTCFFGVFPPSLPCHWGCIPKNCAGEMFISKRCHQLYRSWLRRCATE